MSMPDDPYLALARELRTQVEEAMAAGTDVDRAFERVRGDERRRIARATFDALPPERRWEILAATFDDAEVREALETRRVEARERLARTEAARRAAADAGRTRRVEFAAVPADLVVTMGLFRPGDVRDALVAGPRSTSCARRLVVRTTGTSVVHALADVFNPEHGLYVTPDYDESVWAGERLASHDLVTLGSAGSNGFEPALYLGGRVDTDQQPGRLHLGWLQFDDVAAAAEQP